MAWVAQDYVKAKFFQQALNHDFLEQLPETPAGNILDIGCGEGELSWKLATNYRNVYVKAIDNSKDMIKHARQNHSMDNLDFELQDAESFHFSTPFDVIFSFWCLHWTNIQLSLKKIYDNLKPSGKTYLIFSSLTNNSIFQTWAYLSQMENKLDVFKQLHLNVSTRENIFFFDVIHELNKLPFRSVNIKLMTKCVKLPDLSYFKHLILAMPFAKRINADELEEFCEQMTMTFYEICQKKYNGELIYETRPITVYAYK